MGSQVWMWGEDGASIFATINGVERKIASLPLVDGGGRFERQSRAKLIAATPELFRALEELVHQVETSGAVDANAHPLKNLQALRVAREALSKATGESLDQS